MVTPTAVRVTPDLSLARVYVSIFAGPTPQEVFDEINKHKARIKGDVGRVIKSLHHIPELRFFIDDSLDYAEKIDDLLKNG